MNKINQTKTNVKDMLGSRHDMNRSVKDPISPRKSQKLSQQQMKYIPDHFGGWS